MHFGVSFQSHILNSWKHAVLAEQMRFTHAWFVDTQMLASDVYACMVLAAEHTRTIRLGTAVAVAGTRLAPVIAHSIATINQLAPGRVILGLGTGHTAWRAMGLSNGQPARAGACGAAHRRGPALCLRSRQARKECAAVSTDLSSSRLPCISGPPLA